jgi:hypothetical protein
LVGRPTRTRPGPLAPQPLGRGGPASAGGVRCGRRRGRRRPGP